MVKAVVILLLVLLKNCHGFTAPEVTLEAYEPKGFRASIPAVAGIQLFAFHANINKDISQVDPGEYRQDFTSATDKHIWSYYNPDLTLKVGDVVNYWIFIQHDKLGYRRDNQKWKVTELIKLSNSPCEESISTVSGKTLICKNNLLFEDVFNKPELDTKKWTVEQYIPTYSSTDYEYVSYQKSPDVLYMNDNKLFIKPQVASSESEVISELDLQSGCTRPTKDECYFKPQIYLIAPPVTSARLVSSFKFKYGKIEIKAKLPAGDWIYPQLYLEQENNPRKKLWIAYARGNDKLLANNQEDIGGSLLFAGPVVDPEEPERSQYLRTKANKQLWTSKIRTYTVTWTKDSIKMAVDGEEFGSLDKKALQDIGFAETFQDIVAEDDMVHIVLGVGVGGVNDFPDDYRSGNNVKPWRNNGNKQVKDFFDARNEWQKTWKLTTNNRALQVESVKVWAV